jgi:signal transduction histidine kinase
VVDDNPANLGVIYDYLTEKGFKIFLSQDGKTALELAEKTNPDLILLDIIMPGMDGFEVCMKLKNNPFLCEIPIIFMSALTDIVDKLKGFEVGGVDYITKPLSQPEVLARVSAHLLLRQQQKELIQLNHDKDKFFSIIAHDLRNPFFTLLGFSEFLAENVRNLAQEEIEESANNILYSAKSMHDLLENLLYWSRLKTNKIDMDKIKFELNLIIDRILNLYKASISKKKLNVENLIDDKVVLLADKNMIETVMRNLIANAIKFTGENGTIRILSEKNEKSWKIVIEDDGIGMSESDMLNLFNNKLQVSKEGIVGQKGTGLGLILCKEFIEKHSGSISAESKLNKGTKFYLELPVSA